MRRFEVHAHALIPEELRRKLDNHSEIGQCIGYPANIKGYMIALPSGRVIDDLDHLR